MATGVSAGENGIASVGTSRFGDNDILFLIWVIRQRLLITFLPPLRIGTNYGLLLLRTWNKWTCVQVALFLRRVAFSLTLR